MSETMNNDLINAIVGKADAEAAAIIEKAEEYAREKRAAARENAAKEAELIARTAHDKAEDVKVKRATAARMERNKMILAAKRRAIDGVYERLLDAVRSLDGKAFLAVVDAAVKKYGATGQKVILSASAPVTEKEVAALPAVKEKKLTAEKSEDVRDGFVLAGDTFDLDFTCAAIVNGMRERTEKEVVDEMFGEKR